MGMKLAQVSACDMNLELPFGSHHWLCHHFVTCFLDFVSWSWVSELAFIPVECACSVSMWASPLTPHSRLSLSMVLVTCIPWICEINVNPSQGADEDSKSIKRRKHASSYLIVRLILWNKIGIHPFARSFLSQPILWLSFSILLFPPLKKKKSIKLQNSVSQHLFSLRRETEYVWKENGRLWEVRWEMAPFLNSLEGIWFHSVFTPLPFLFPPNSFTLCGQKIAFGCSRLILILKFFRSLHDFLCTSGDCAIEAAYTIGFVFI